DADERISPELERALDIVIREGAYPVYWVTIEDIFLGKRMTHLAGHNPRLIQKQKAYWSNANVHERMIYADIKHASKYKDTTSGEITQPIVHKSYTSISAYLVKMHRYTSLDAAEMQKTGTHRSGMHVTKNIFLPYYLASKQFIKLFFYRKGFLDSWQGLVWCTLSGYYEYEMGKKYLSL
ncbi:MAG TPA: hypothetical protein VLG69_00055, partial [Candidatus Andersenbacteria bacterium]|nr:hypothetical protein [Candidatus Andersenbacteria bacterium]